MLIPRPVLRHGLHQLWPVSSFRRPFSVGVDGSPPRSSSELRHEEESSKLEHRRLRGKQPQIRNILSDHRHWGFSASHPPHCLAQLLFGGQALHHRYRITRADYPAFHSLHSKDTNFMLQGSLGGIALVSVHRNHTLLNGAQGEREMRWWMRVFIMQTIKWGIASRAVCLLLCWMPTLCSGCPFNRHADNPFLVLWHFQKIEWENEKDGTICWVSEVQFKRNRKQIDIRIIIFVDISSWSNFLYGYFRLHLVNNQAKERF